MKRIKVTIMCGGIAEPLRCTDLLAEYPEILIVDQISDINRGRAALGGSDILILDEVAIDREGFDAVRKLLIDGAGLKSLLITNINNYFNVLLAVSLGIKGVVAHTKMATELRLALAAIYTDEAWIPRGLVEPLRDELVGMERMACWSAQSPLMPGRDRMN